ncbi:MAG: NAD(P)-binding domain-containing protein [Nitrospirae bacterium]|nr:NAD(P)-binding domain-containing protein [Nitrospirota bacterium]
MNEPRRLAVGVVGNGPSAICLSLFLSGWRPMYAGPHPDPDLARRLHGVADLLATDLGALSRGLGGRGNNPLANLFDALHHPQADGGGVRPPCIRLRHDPHRAVPHMVLGSGPPGGSWHAMPEGMLTLSPGHWMELPGWPLFDWGRAGGRWIDPGRRLERALVADYFRDYVTHMGLAERFATGLRVTAAEPDPGGWRVTARSGDGAEHAFRFQRLVLATGMYDRPRRLGIGGEDLGLVSHRAGDCAAGDGPVLVAGAGLSAADGILAARQAGRAVVHAFVDDPAATAMARLDPALYPEYHWLARAMAGPGEAGYVPLAGTRLTAVGADGTCALTGPHGAGTVRVATVAVLIGSDPDLGCVAGVLPPGAAPDPLTFRLGPSGLYAIGPLAGDNFVRFVTGHALGAARHILARG